MPTIAVVTIGNVELQLRFLLAKTPFDLLLNFVVDPFSIPLLIAFMLGSITISTHVVVILALND
jgi:hypothetical protein